MILDTAGRLHVDEELMTELREVKERVSPFEVVFVADAMTGSDAVKSAVRFQEEIGFDSVILTKLDADSRGGAALSIAFLTGKPIKFAGMGEGYDKLEPFHPERLASRILGWGTSYPSSKKLRRQWTKKRRNGWPRRWPNGSSLWKTSWTT